MKLFQGALKEADNMADDYFSQFEAAPKDDYFNQFEAPATSLPTRTEKEALDARRFRDMGTIDDPTLGEQFIATGIGGLEAAGRLPGEIAAIPATLGEIAAGGQSGGLAGVTRQQARTLEELIQPIQNLAPKFFNALGYNYYDPNSPQMRSPEAAALGEIITNTITGVGGLPKIQRIPQILREIGKTIATGASTTVGAPLFRGLKSAEPFVSGKKLAEAESTLESVLQRESALARDIQESALKQATMRGEAAGLGREALATQRAARIAEGQITPEIVSAQTSIEQASRMPPVILGKTAQEPAAFGRTMLEGIEKPMAQSRAQYTKAYDAVKESLPAAQVKLESEGLYDAAQSAGNELSQGFETYNKGEIRRIIDESIRTKTTQPPGSPELRKIYEGSTPAQQAALLRQHPELGAKAIVERPSYNWDELQKRFQQINDAIAQAAKHELTGDVRILERLKQGVRADMENYASEMGTEVYDRFNQANKAFQAHQNKFGLNRLQTIFRDDVVQNPEFVADKLFGDNSPSVVEAIKGIVTPEEFAQVQARYSKKLFSPNRDTPFDASHFIKRFSDDDADETLRAVYGQEGFNQLKQIYEASKGFEKIEGLQKNLDNIQKTAETSAEAFAKAKKSLNNQFNSFRDADVQDRLKTVNREVQDARTELDRVKNYRDLKDWARRLTGVNILQAASDSPSGLRLATMISALSSQPFEEPQLRYRGPLPGGGESLPYIGPTR